MEKLLSYSQYGAEFVFGDTSRQNLNLQNGDQTWRFIDNKPIHWLYNFTFKILITVSRLEFFQLLCSFPWLFLYSITSDSWFILSENCRGFSKSRAEQPGLKLWLWLETFLSDKLNLPYLSSLTSRISQLAKSSAFGFYNENLCSDILLLATDFFPGYSLFSMKI